MEESWDLWLSVSVFAYNTTVSSSTGVTSHYTVFGHEGMLPVDQRAYKSMREVQSGRVRQNEQIYKPLAQNIWVRCLVLYFGPRIIPGTSHKLGSFWAGPYQVIKIIAPTLAKIKLVYHLGEEKLVSLEV